MAASSSQDWGGVGTRAGTPSLPWPGSFIFFNFGLFLKLQQMHFYVSHPLL